MLPSGPGGVHNYLLSVHPDTTKIYFIPFLKNKDAKSADNCLF
ncbi:hypothetical protein AZO1586I_1326 [Bathymodiolus thermophilus thioautotrophic gill symbiont]|uniref:Uncharacterized protein n=2 Tax=sulfur-oxidizing symbionts TaxID=32036 RepID=A0ACA8ZP93_9GAMM|nr:hypothetical protein AZO1586R_480 [Bathymodiolus azoricus thioautotrophic gill symbiont]CAB5504674.1 hypothetical protein AZO1586I_1326 [Bathymodiolus thermophilus thioautotrophic gill symbiont]CAC5823172.1 hypothetical protein [uncultured Gammaproteobacteria bacterium]CAC9575450.1 hypothetical protein [uncultured Gammaproteobacteria bacterium]CAC9979544.1 hypothetical protein [uncultured Gammaproteobacteria bacterium]